jgi:hypothetical protein
MRLLLFAGLLYLIGISIILVLRPEIMFAKSGKWKEFGLGRNREQYTWMPFWLFSIIWAIVSYIVIISIASAFSGPSIGSSISLSNNIQSFEKEIEVNIEDIEPSNISKKTSIQSITSAKPIRKASSSPNMKHGYYILDTQETIKTGIPKYIFLGPEAPNLVYNNGIELTSNLQE